MLIDHRLPNLALRLVPRRWLMLHRRLVLLLRRLILILILILVLLLLAQVPLPLLFLLLLCLFLLLLLDIVYVMITQNTWRKQVRERVATVGQILELFQVRIVFLRAATTAAIGPALILVVPLLVSGALILIVVLLLLIVRLILVAIVAVVMLVLRSILVVLSLLLILILICVVVIELNWTRIRILEWRRRQHWLSWWLLHLGQLWRHLRRSQLLAKVRLVLVWIHLWSLKGVHEAHWLLERRQASWWHVGIRWLLLKLCQLRSTCGRLRLRQLLVSLLVLLLLACSLGRLKRLLSLSGCHESLVERQLLV